MAKRMNFTDDVSAVMRALWPQRAPRRSRKTDPKRLCSFGSSADVEKFLCLIRMDRSLDSNLYFAYNISLRRSSIFFLNFTHILVCVAHSIADIRASYQQFFFLFSLSLTRLTMCARTDSHLFFVCDDFARCSTRIFLISARRPALVRSYQKSSFFLCIQKRIKI